MLGSENLEDLINLKNIEKDNDYYKIILDIKKANLYQFDFTAEFRFNEKRISFVYPVDYIDEITLQIKVPLEKLKLPDYLTNGQSTVIWQLYIHDHSKNKKYRVGNSTINNLDYFTQISDTFKIEPQITNTDDFAIKVTPTTNKNFVYVNNIYWNRMGLNIEGAIISKFAEHLQNSFFCIKKNETIVEKYSLALDKKEIGSFTFTLSYKNIDMLDDDSYSFTISTETPQGHFMSEELYILEESPKILYAQNATHSVEVSSTGTIIFYKSIEKPVPKHLLMTNIKNAFIEKRDRLKGRLLKKVFMSFKNHPFAETTYMFESFGGRQFSDSPKAIYEALLSINPAAKTIWSIDKSLKKEFKKNNLAYVVNGSIKWAIYFARSQFWISNARLPLWFQKSSYTKYIQTWHGTPLKKLGLDIDKVSMPGTTTKKYRRNFVREANKWDVLISPNQYSTKIFRSAFSYKGKIFEAGYPRNDKLIYANQKAYIDEMKTVLGLPKNKKIILYAPTWRDNDYIKKGQYNFKLPLQLDRLKSELGDDYVLVIRMHYLIANQIDITGYEDFIYNLSSYPDISDLYLVSDLLITDYSSVFFDYAILKKPIIFYAYDLDYYADHLRGFYLDYFNDLPGSIVQTTAALIQEIKNPTDKEAAYHEFYEQFCKTHDGKAAMKIAQFLLSY